MSLCRHHLLCMARVTHKGVGASGECALAGAAIMATLAKDRVEVMLMAERCSVCGGSSGIRSQCPRSQGRVVCRDCCIGLDRLDGHNCRWWELCTATDLGQWEW